MSFYNLVDIFYSHFNASIDYGGGGKEHIALKIVVRDFLLKIFKKEADFEQNYFGRIPEAFGYPLYTAYSPTDYEIKLLEQKTGWTLPEILKNVKIIITAYRAGFFAGYTRDLPLKTCGQMGAVAAAYAIETYGTQAHNFTLEEFCQRYQKTFQERLMLFLSV